MNSSDIPTGWILLGLFAIAIIGLSALVWMAPVQAGDITPAQDRLWNIADWMVKTAVGAILGFSGARLAARGRNQAT